MADENDAPPDLAARRNRACDSCFNKKIKCDREDPCANCVAALVPCLRARPKRRGRLQEQDRRNSHASTTRFARQRSLRQGSLRHAYSSQPHSLDGVGGASSDYRTGVPGPQSNERSTLTGDGGGAASTSSPAVAEAGCGAVSERRPDYRPDTTTHQAAETEHTPASQAQTYIESELQSCQCMDYGRREILLSALAFASQASSQTATLRDPEPCTLDDANFDSENMFPSAQTLHFILNGHSRKSVGSSFFLDMGTIISKATLEKQGLALVEGRVEGPTRLHYMVNVNFVAWMYLGATNSSDVNSPMRNHLADKQKKYGRNILAALRRFSILDATSRTMFQALLAGALYTMLTGRLQNCWHLSSAASRTCVALGGRYFASLASGPSTDEAMEARYCLTLCYMFDKSLSLSMNRASCLPDMELDVFMLVPATPDRPFTALINIFLELAQVQDGIVRDTKTWGSSNVRLERIQALQQKMWQIWDRMQEFRSQPPHNKESYLVGEWMGAEFAYYSILSSIMRFHPYLQRDTGLQDQLLRYARLSMTSLKEMLDHATTLVDLHTFRVSVSWLLLFYPLSPFFTLFCHVVEGSYNLDFKLIQEVTGKLGIFAQWDSPVIGVYKLFYALVDLSKPLVGDQGPSESEPPPRTLQQPLSSSLHATSTTQTPVGARAVIHTNPDDNSNILLPREPANQFPAPIDHVAATWSRGQSPVSGMMAYMNTLGDDDLMQELYNVQPSLGWIDRLGYDGNT